jgi:hypothetical protein
MTGRTPQWQLVLNAIRLAEPSGVTSLEIIELTRICCFTKRVSELRRMGYVIEMVESWRGGVRVCRYFYRGFVSGSADSEPALVAEGGTR